MKGGHLEDAQSPDWLFTREGEQRFSAPRVNTKNTHGTGCTLSAALAALRPRHRCWGETVNEAKAWLSAALAQADTLEVGKGIGRYIISTRGGIPPTDPSSGKINGTSAYPAHRATE